MGKLSALANEQTNPQLADRMHIIHQIAGVWYSYWISLTTLKTLILSWIYGFKITKEVYVTTDTYFDYTPDQYELVERIILKGGTANIAISIVDYGDAVIYESDGANNLVGIYNEHATGYRRKLRITPSEDCTIVIISNTNI